MFNVLLRISDSLRTPLILFRATSPASVGAGGKVKFSSVTENVGNGYNSKTGVFTATHEGLHMFSINMCTENNVDSRYGIKRVGTWLISTRIIDEKRDSCGAMTAPAALKKGDSVYVECIMNCKIIQSYGQETNTFSGALVFSL